MTDINRARGAADDDFETGGEADLRRRAQEAFSQGVDTARYQAMQARDFAEEQFEQARQYVTQRVTEKPMQSALVALGAGVVLGMLLKGGRR